MAIISHEHLRIVSGYKLRQGGFCHNNVTTSSRRLSSLLCILSVEFIVCVIGFNFYPEEEDLIVLTDVDPGIERLAIMDLIKLTDSIRLKVLESTLAVACQIGRAVLRGGERIFGNN